jgi:hypothetical protein
MFNTGTPPFPAALALYSLNFHPETMLMKSAPITGILAACLLAGCSPRYYAPNTHNVPLMREKGQINLQVSGNSDLAEFQGAYALSKQFAMQLNGALFVPKDHENGNGGSGSFAEGGFGYYKPVRNNFVFETYGLLAYGSFENHLPSTIEDYPGTSGKISSAIFRYGIQPSFGYFSKYFSIAVSARLLGLNYSGIQGNLTYNNEDQIALLKSQNSSLLLEPALTIRGGLERIKLQLQLGGSYNLTHSNFRQDHSLMSIGLHFRFSDVVKP